MMATMGLLERAVEIPSATPSWLLIHLITIPTAMKMLPNRASLMVLR
jgi:hypothetical protein